MERCIKRTPRRLAGAIRDRGRSGLDLLGKVNFNYSQTFAGLYEKIRGRPRGRFNIVRQALFLMTIV